MVLNIDLGPTFIALSGGEPPDEMDGSSMEPLLKNKKPSQLWRHDALIEYWGESMEFIKGCPQFTNAGVSVIVYFVEHTQPQCFLVH